MSGLLRRAPFLIVAAALGFVGTDARAAGYLFRLTEDEILGTMDYYYPKGYDKKLVLQQMSEPFDCRNFGDLCREVGEESAAVMLETAWARAKRRMPIESIDRAAQEELEAYELRWFERRFPDGVDPKDPYWGPFLEPGDEVTECVDTVTRDSGNFRMVQTSRRHSLAVIVWGRIRAEHFKKNLSGKYKPEKADLLEVSGRVIIQAPDFDPVETPLFDIKTTARHVAAGKSEGGLGIWKVPFVEGCGGDSNNSALFACTCSGELPFGF